MRALGTAITVWLVVASARGEVVSIQHEARGWVSSNSVSNGRLFENNYLAGQLFDSQHNDEEYRNWFAFRIPPLARNESFVAAQLLLSTHLYESLDRSETYELRHIALPPGSLGSFAPEFAAIEFSDLGDGPSYGARTFTPEDQEDVRAIALNNLALANINASAGRLFELGGVIASLSPLQYTEVLFYGSNATNFSRLNLTTAIVPEPSCWAILLTVIPFATWFAARGRLNRALPTRR